MRIPWRPSCASERITTMISGAASPRRNCRDPRGSERGTARAAAVRAVGSTPPVTERVAWTEKASPEARADRAAGAEKVGPGGLTLDDGLLVPGYAAEHP